MSIVAQYLFGSYARADFSDASDVDILSITDDGLFRNLSVGLLNISFYPQDRFLAAASKGDLFAMHIIREARLIFSSNNFSENLKKAFVYKTDYSRDVKQAGDLAWFLIDNYTKFNDHRFLNRRIAWCVRTILIAFSAADRNPVFSTSALVTTSNFSNVSMLLGRKSASDFHHEIITILNHFLNHYGLRKPDRFDNANIKDWWWHFRLLNNAVALKTIDAVITSVSADIYEIGRVFG